MKLKEIQTGETYRVKRGPFKDKVACVLDATPDQPGHTGRVRVSVIDGSVRLDYETMTTVGVDTEEMLLPADLAPLTVAVPHSSAAEPTTTVTIDSGEFSIDGFELPSDPDDPTYDAYRPDVDVVKRYINRSMPNGMKDVDFFMDLRDRMRTQDGYAPNVCLKGDTQSGKTMFVQVMAVIAAKADGRAKPYPVFTLNGSLGVTNQELFGLTTAVIINGKEVLVWVDGIVSMALACGGFLYLDEWNAVPPAQATALHSVLDDRRAFVNYNRAVDRGDGGFIPQVIKANTNLWTWVTINDGYRNLSPMAEATTNRLTFFDWDYDDRVEAKVIPSRTIRNIGDAGRTAYAQRSLNTPLGTSALMKFNTMVGEYGTTTAMYSFLSMFSGSDRDRMRTIIEDRGFEDLLKSEYPHPTDTDPTTTTTTSEEML